MTTATAPRYDPAFDVTRLKPSKTQPRTHFNPVRLQELADSSKEHGVIEPLIVRSTNGADAGDALVGMEIVAGERRWRAAKLAGLAVVPVIIRELTDTQVREIQLIENIHRDDLTPLEQAKAYRGLIDSNPAKYSAAFIGQRLGKSEKWVWDLMKLLDLIPEAKRLLEREYITVSHAILLARLKPEQQNAVIDPSDGGLFEDESDTLDFFETHQGQQKAKKADPYFHLKAVSVKQLEAYIADHIRFDPTYFGAAAPLEFGAVAEEVEKRAALPGRGKKVICITHDSHVEEDAKDEHERIYASMAWKRADGREKSKLCEHAVLGVVTVGPEYGQAFDVCIARDKCQVHWQAAQREKVKRQKEAATGRPDRSAARLAAQRQREEAQRAKGEAERKAFEKAVPAILEAVVAKVQTVKIGAIADMVLRACDHSYNAPNLKTARAQVKPPKSADDVVRLAALTVLVHDLKSWDACEHFPKSAKRFGLDVAAIVKAQARPVQTSAVKAGKKKGGRHAA